MMSDLATDAATRVANAARRDAVLGRCSALRDRLPRGAAAFGGVLGVANVGALVLGMVVSLLLARSLAPDEFGRVAFWMNAFLVTTLIAGCGLTTAVAAEVARLRSSSASWLAVRRLWGLRLATLPVAAAMVGSAAAWTGWDEFWLVAGVAMLAVALDFFVGIFQGLQHLKALLALLLAQPALYLALLLTWPAATAEQVLATLAASYVLPTGVAFVSLCRTGGDWVWPCLDRDAWRQVRPSSVAAGAYAIAFVQVGFLTVGPLALGAAGRFREAAVLSVVLALVRLVPVIWGATLAAVLFPRLAACHADRDARATLVCSAAQALAVVAVPAALALAAFPGVALTVLFGATYAAAADLLVVASVLVVALAVEALLTWMALGVGRPSSAVAGTSARLGLLLIGVVASVLVTPASEDAVRPIVWAHVLAAVAGVLVQAVLIRDECDVGLVAGLLAAATLAAGPAAGFGWLALPAVSGLPWSVAVAACASFAMVGGAAGAVALAARLRRDRGPARARRVP